jgi:hypothetical protein
MLFCTVGTFLHVDGLTARALHGKWGQKARRIDASRMHPSSGKDMHPRFLGQDPGMHVFQHLWEARQQ